jgi:hypothetical protein
MHKFQKFDMKFNHIFLHKNNTFVILIKNANRKFKKTFYFTLMKQVEKIHVFQSEIRNFWK